MPSKRNPEAVRTPKATRSDEYRRNFMSCASVFLADLINTFYITIEQDIIGQSEPICIQIPVFMPPRPSLWASLGERWWLSSCVTSGRRRIDSDVCCPTLSHAVPQKNGETGKLGQDRLKVRWDVALFFLHVIVWNVWLFLFDYLAKCVVEVVVIMFGLNEGDNCWGGQSFYV